MGRVVVVDQSPIGRTPRSNPATYTRISDRIRDIFAALPESRDKGFGKGRFSFNVAGGRCETCQGAGLLQIGMHFLGDVDVVCPDCEGRRFNDETLAVRDRGRTIHDVLEMSVAEAARFYAGAPRLAADLAVLERLGLGYLKLGQSSTTLSGGEAQRVKLASEMSRSASGQVLYILEEPTTGLHRADVENLLAAFQALVSLGRTIIAVEHHPDVIRAADYVVDLGPGSGEDGGRVVACGTPDEIAACAGSLDRAGPARGVCGGRRARRHAGRSGRKPTDRSSSKASRPTTSRGSTSASRSADSRPSADRPAAANPRSSSTRSSPRPGRDTSRASPPTPGRSSTRAAGPTSPPPAA